MEALQFGLGERGRDYPDRPAAFAVAARGGRIALVRITRPEETPYHDLPGGALEAGEDAVAAVIREFGEEAGLVIRPTAEIARFGQYLILNSGAPANNRCIAFDAEIVGEDARLKIEDDHHLVWMTPAEAIRVLRHDGHAWAVAAWLRTRGGRD